MNTLNAKDRLRKFYDQIPIHPGFEEVDNSDLQSFNKYYMIIVMSSCVS